MGPSGCGKSSLARAGLIPELARRPLPARQKARVAILTPGTHPIEALAGVLAKIVTNDIAPVTKTRELTKELKIKNEANEYDGLRRIADLLPDINSSPLIVLVDQFEEVYSLCKDVIERQAFIENLLHASCDRSARVSVILTLRSDFLGETQKQIALSQAITNKGFIVPAMSKKELERAISKPAEVAGYPLDEGVVKLLIEQTEGRVGALPLLQFALSRIWSGLREGISPAETLEKIGGVGGALAGVAQRIFDSLDTNEKVLARRVFLGLVELGEGVTDTRRRTEIESLVSHREKLEQVKKVIAKFASVNARLITVSGSDGTQRAEVTHEALFEHWQQLQGWLEKNREALRKQREIESDAKSWAAHKKIKDFLSGGFKLAEAEKVLLEYGTTVPLSMLAQEFIEESKKQELRSYLQLATIDGLDQMGLKDLAAAKSFLTKRRLWHLLEDLGEDPKVRLGASWVLKQWGEQVPMWFAKTDGSGKITLVVIEEKQPPTVREDLGNGISLELVAIPGGEFWMGAPEGEEGGNWWERPPHLVKVSPFLISKYPVTQSQWRAIATDNPVEIGLNPEPSYFKGDSRPVESISWYEAVEFCQRLSRKSGKEYRLPSEAEWEYACRAIENPKSQLQNVSYAPYHFGEKIDPALANYIETSRGKTNPVGRFQVVNNFGLYDMHGNVWEWCSDDWHDDYEGAPTDGRAWRRRGGLWSSIKGTDNHVVVRGGSWLDNPDTCRSASRFHNSRVPRYNGIGFRVVRVAPRTT